MGENTKIEWTATYLDDGTVIPGNTFNPWIGCTKVSDGCKNCYAEHLMDHRWGKVQWGPQGTRQRTSADMWKQPLKWNEKAMRGGYRAKVFCASLADVFEDRDELKPWRADLLHLIVQTPHLDWLLLTKRPENVNRLIEEATGFSESSMWFPAVGDHVWIGTSVENQEMANKRIPHLLQVPAAVRFLSCEPLLGPIDLGRAIGCGYYCDEVVGHVNHPFWTRGIASPIHWVIVGGESGPGARPMHPDWARSLRDQCNAAGVAYFFKQWGEWYPNRTGIIEGATTTAIMGDTVVHRVGKKAAGRLLDGREWSEFPRTEAMPC